eukprot:Em0012g1033a
MEGTLWKWTNYISGWQQRWFVLNSGVLYYYLSESEVGQACKGSLKVASCDIMVHPNDPLRMDIIIPRERHLYLRAPSNSERQEWLVALGSMKQEDLSTFVSEKKRTDALNSKMVELHLNCQLLTSQLAAIKTSVTQPQSSLEAHKLQEISSEVSTTCDKFLNLLAECMDLTSDVKWPLDLKPLVAKRHGKASPSVEHRLLAQNSEAFARPPLTPDLKSTNGILAGQFSVPSHPPSHGIPSHREGHSPHRESHSPGHTPHRESHSPHKESHSPHREVTSSPTVTTPHRKCNDERTLEGSSAAREEGGGGEVRDQPSQQVIKAATSKDVPSGGPAGSGVPNEGITPMSGHSGLTRHASSQSELFHTPKSSPVPSPPPSPPMPRPPPTVGCIVGCWPRVSKVDTFFSRVIHKFENLMLTKDGGIPTSPFLNCCKEMIPFLDTLNSTAFAPVKADIGGNIEKLTKKYNTDPQLFVTLQSMVLQELNTNTHNEKNSSTDALLWLKRAMEFIQVFISEVAEGEQSLDTAAGTAYGKTLRRYHNWIVRGIFGLAVKAVPYYQDFMNQLGSDGSAQANEAVLQDMATFAASLGHLVRLIGTFYVDHKLDNLPSVD